MRCLIFIALCFVFANASYFNKNRFHKLLNRYQNRFDLSGNQWYGNMYGWDDMNMDMDMDMDMDEYVDQIRTFERDQCPRDIDDIFNVLDMDQYDMTDFDFDDVQGRNGYSMLGRTDMMDMMHDDEYSTPLLKEVEHANKKLACRLYQECKDERDDKNIVVSPVSIQLALAALNYGTRGNTKHQIGRVIGGRLQKNERRQVYKTLIRSLKGLNGFSTIGQTQIKPVTAIFISQTTPAQQMFIQMIKGNLGATVKHCNFHRQPQQCRQMINHLMAQKTQGKLAHIVPQDAITDNTKMVLVNSMHVKANWGPQMRQHITKEAKFYPLNTKNVKIVEVMETEGKFKYYEDELVKIVGVPTEQKELTMYVIVPKEKDGLTEVEKLHLQDNVQLKQLLDMTDRRARRVAVQLPKFQIKHKVDVRRTLRKQGVIDAFDPHRADFSPLTGVSKYEEMEHIYNPIHGDSLIQDGQFENGLLGNWQTGVMDTKLHLNKFIHQSTIKITENGIMASTGSGNEWDNLDQYQSGMRYGRLGGLTGLSGLDNEEMNVFDEITGFNFREPMGQKVVKVNRAFAFVVKHNPTNQLVFVGRVIDAAQKKVGGLNQNVNLVDQW